MRRFLIGLLLLGSVIAIVAVIARRRSSSVGDEWDSFAEDPYGRASESVSKVTDTATESVSKAEGAAKDSVSKAAGAAKESISKAADAAQKSISKAAGAAKDA